MDNKIQVDPKYLIPTILVKITQCCLAIVSQTYLMNLFDSWFIKGIIVVCFMFVYSNIMHKILDLLIIRLIIKAKHDKNLH